MSKLLSVIVPAYNAEKYLKRCLTSLKRQLYSNLEFVCIDDGSVDGTVDILTEFAASDKRVKVVTTKNRGYGAACNTGLEKANGDYITFLESDDFCTETYYEEMMYIAEKYTCDLVKSDYYKYWNINNREYVRIFPQSAYLKLISPKDLLDSFNIYGIAPSIWSAIYSRELLDGIRFLETPGAAFQDTSFGIKVLEKAKCAYFVNKAFVSYRQHSDQSVANAKNPFALCEEFAEVEKAVPMNPSLKKAKFNRYMWNYKRIDDKHKLKFLEVIHEEFPEENEVELP